MIELHIFHVTGMYQSLVVPLTTVRTGPAPGREGVEASARRRPPRESLLSPSHDPWHTSQFHPDYFKRRAVNKISQDNFSRALLPRVGPGKPPARARLWCTAS